MKIIFIDKNEKLKELAKQESRVEVFDCLSLDTVEADAISTCSNPDYDFAGGIDAYFAKRFNLKESGKWLEVREGDEKIKNIVLNETVDDDRQASYRLVRKAYVNFLNLARNRKWKTIILTGFGTGVGGLSEEECIKALSEALDMIDTIEGKMNVPLIEIRNVIVESCHNMQVKYCDDMQAKHCRNMQAKYCHNMQAESCYELFLFGCSGKTDTCYTIQHSCGLTEINPKGENDFVLIFLSQFDNNIAYKYLTPDWESPIADRKIKYEVGMEVESECDKDTHEDCSYGINLATLGWCLRERQSDSILVAFEFDPKDAVVPDNTDGKFRVSKAKCLYEVDEEGNRLI